MSDRVGIRELAQMLAEKNHLPIKDSETFVELLFEILNEGLNNDKQAKVKGLGTFKITNVSARKSIDVNTGEPILIESRDKISFTADAIMRDLVNRPFAQFETVVLNDGVDFSEVDAKYEDVDEEGVADSWKPDLANDVEPEAVNADAEPATIDAVSVEESLTEMETEVEETLSTAENESHPSTAHFIIDAAQLNILNESENEEEDIFESTSIRMQLSPGQLLLLNAVDASKVEEEVTEEVEEEVQLLVEHIVEPAGIEPVEPEEKPIIKEAVNEETPAENNDDKLQEEEEENGRKYHGASLIAIFAVLLALLSGVLYYAYHQVNERNMRISQLESLLQKKKVMEEKVVPAKAVGTIDTIKNAYVDSDCIVSEKEVDEKTPNITTQQPIKVAKETTLQPVVEKPQIVATLQEKSGGVPKEHLKVYDEHPLVRTGAYYIIGVDKEVVLKEGEDLKVISKRYLGPDMECYLEVLNGGVKALKSGSKVKIPKLKLKKKKK